VYDFLRAIPADNGAMARIHDDQASHKDILPADQVYKCLYMIYALEEYVRLTTTRYGLEGSWDRIPDRKPVQRAITRDLRLVIAALADPELPTEVGADAGGAGADTRHLLLMHDLVMLFNELLYSMYLNPSSCGLIQPSNVLTR